MIIDFWATDDTGTLEIIKRCLEADRDVKALELYNLMPSVKLNQKREISQKLEILETSFNYRIKAVEARIDSLTKENEKEALRQKVIAKSTCYEIGW